jgi:uncharacterized membrane protein YqaE (UPF0057 family)
MRAWTGVGPGIIVSDSSITLGSFGENTGMGLGRALLCIFLPPLAVLDKGCGTILLVSLLTLAGWVPGVIGALVVCGRADRR